MEYIDFRPVISDEIERCDKCKKLLQYSPGSPGYIYTNDAKQYCPTCMTALNDAQKNRRDSIKNYSMYGKQLKPKKSFFDYF